MPRRTGWSWNLIRRLPDWVVRMRIIALKRREQTEDIKGEIADCEQQLSFRVFSRSVRKIYIEMFGEPFPEGRVWPRK